MKAENWYSLSVLKEYGPTVHMATSVYFCEYIPATVLLCQIKKALPRLAANYHTCSSAVDPPAGDDTTSK